MITIADLIQTSGVLPGSSIINNKTLAITLEKEGYYDIEVIKEAKNGILLEATVHQMRVIISIYPRLHSITQEHIRAVLMDDKFKGNVLWSRVISFKYKRHDLSEVLMTLRKIALSIRKHLDDETSLI